MRGPAVPRARALGPTTLALALAIAPAAAPAQPSEGSGVEADPAAASAPRGTRPVRRLESAPPSEGQAPGGGIYGLDAFPQPGAPLDGTQAPVPEQHVVQKGDTLWSLCSQYFNDSWRWPQLWARNPHVTNPHWIFPGDVLRLRDAGPPAPPRPPGGPGLRVTSNRQGSLDSNAVVLRAAGFIEARALAESARVVGSKEEKIMLATGDQAYIGFAQERPLRAGERYTVFVADTENPVRTPDGKKLLGYLVRIYGDLQLDQISDREMGRGTLVDLMEPVERGYRVSPHVQQFRRVEPRASTVSLEARVVAAFAPTIMLASESFVVLSRGSRDGVSVGNRAFVVRRGDGHRPIMEGWNSQDPRFPKEWVAELWILDVRDEASVAWVARSTKELRVGEVTELRRGY